MKTVQIDVTTLNIVAGVLVPLLVRIVTKEVANRAVKSIANLALSAVAGGLAVAIAANGQINARAWVVSIGTTFIASIAAYKGLWDPTGVADKVGSATANFGVGGGNSAP